MFRKKKQEPPMTKLLEIYNEIANNSLTNLSLEQNNRSNEALSGWRSLHFIASTKMEQLENIILNQELTDEETYLLDEIRILQAQADDHLARLDNKLSSQHELGNRMNQQSSRSNSASQLSGPTMRTSTPTTMKTKKIGGKPLMKTLRSSPATLGGISGASTSSAAKQAANLIWSPNSSLTYGKSPSHHTFNSGGHSHSADDLFKDFDQNLEMDRDARQQETLRTLQQLQQKGAVSQSVRGNNDYMEDLIDLSPNLSRLDLNTNNSHTVSTSPPKRYVKTSAERAQAALKISANVKLRAPANTRAQSQSPVRLLHNQSRSTSAGKAHYHTTPKPQHHHNAHTAATRVSRPKKAVTPAKQPAIRHTAKKPSSTPHSTPPTSRKVSPAVNQTPALAEGKDTETLSSDTEETDGDKLISSLRGVDPTAAKQILNEIVVNGDEVHWEDIAGLDGAKDSLKETVVYPFLRPDLFSGLREPARGMLLFGPPGTGKTMLARAVATESKSTFFSISASSLTSKYLGESEKLVRALFQLAKKMAPSIIFVDEIDSLLGSRNNESENESSRRIKNEFLVQWSDLTKAAAGRDQGDDLNRVLVLAATNLPWAIDEAARRRFVRRQYIPLPEEETRKAQLTKLLSHQKHTLSTEDFEELIELTDSFSGSDITALAKDAAMGPLRELGDKLLMTSKNEIRPLCLRDFVNSLNYIRPSVSKEGLKEFEDWAKLYGSSGA